jgi:hypothetical protein
VYSRVHVLLMPIKWKLQDFFVADFLSHLVEKETETELSLSHVVVVGSDRIGSDRIGSDRISIFKWEKGRWLFEGFDRVNRIMDGGPMGFARMNLLEDFRIYL